MVDDIRQYDGSSRVRASKQDATSVRAAQEPPRIHATRSRTDALESRLADMLFPTNDHPWDMSPTPDDEWEAPDPQDPSTAGYGAMLPNGPPTAPTAAPQQPPQQGDPSQDPNAPPQAQDPNAPPQDPSAQGQPQQQAQPQPPSPA